MIQFSWKQKVYLALLIPLNCLIYTLLLYKYTACTIILRQFGAVQNIYIVA